MTKEKSLIQRLRNALLVGSLGFASLLNSGCCSLVRGVHKPNDDLLGSFPVNLESNDIARVFYDSSSLEFIDHNKSVIKFGSIRIGSAQYFQTAAETKEKGGVCIDKAIYAANELYELGIPSRVCCGNFRKNNISTGHGWVEYIGPDNGEWILDPESKINIKKSRISEDFYQEFFSLDPPYDSEHLRRYIEFNRFNTYIRVPQILITIPFEGYTPNSEELEVNDSNLHELEMF
jgi:transglutaminase-like putative cysteine protease